MKETESQQKLGSKNLRAKRWQNQTISKIPQKILEIPGLEDNYYSNFLSWSKDDLIALVLANSVFIMNNKTGSIDKLYEAFDCEEITSLSWDDTGKLLAMGNILGEVLVWDVEKKTNL